MSLCGILYTQELHCTLLYPVFNFVPAACCPWRDPSEYTFHKHLRDEMIKLFRLQFQAGVERCKKCSKDVSECSKDVFWAHFQCKLDKLSDAQVWTYFLLSWNSGPIVSILSDISAPNSKTAKPQFDAFQCFPGVWHIAEVRGQQLDQEELKFFRNIA